MALSPPEFDPVKQGYYEADGGGVMLRERLEDLVNDYPDMANFFIDLAEVRPDWLPGSRDSRKISAMTVQSVAHEWATEMVRVMGFPSIPGETGPPGEQLVRGCVRLARTFFSELAEPTPWPDKPLPREDIDE